MTDDKTVGQRFTELISHLGISKNAFAASLDKTATVIQHLVDERNKPGFDLLKKVFEVYPNVSKDWLIEGKGSMLTDATSAARTVQGAKQPEAAAPIITEEAPTARQQPAAQLRNETPAASAENVASVSEPAAPVATPPTAATSVATPSANQFVPAVAAAEAPAAPTVPVSAAPDTSWQTALYTQQMAHQLAMAELRNQHLQEQQRLMQQMLDLMQRKM